MFNHNHKPNIMFSLPAGELGSGPYCVFLESSDGQHRLVEAWGFDTPDAAFAHVENLRIQNQKKRDAIITLVGDDNTGVPPAVLDAIREAGMPTMCVYRLEPVDRVDMSSLPPLD